MKSFYVNKFIVIAFSLLFTVCLTAQTNLNRSRGEKYLPPDLPSKMFTENHMPCNTPLQVVQKIMNSSSLKITQMVNQEWVSGTWENKSQSLYEYNSSGYTSIYTSQDWVSGAWENKYKYEYSYLPDGRSYESYAAYEWKNGAWEGTSRYRYTYNSEGRVVSYEGDIWENGAWQQYIRYTYSYNANGNTSEIFGELYVNGSWGNYYKSTYSYNSNGRQTEYTSQYWVNNTWTNSYRTSSEYDNNNNETKYTTQTWDGQGWVNTYQYTYTYNNENRIMEETSYIWNGAGPWTNSAKSIYTYTADGRYDIVTDQIWTLPSGPWTNDGQTIYTYQNGYTQKVLYTKWTGTGWENDSQTLYTYSEITSVEKNDRVPGEFVLLQNYPNPFNPTTMIGYTLHVPGYTTLKIYDLLGREAATLIDEFLQAGSYNIQLSTNHLPAGKLTSGVYFFRLQSGAFSQTKKLVLMK